ncbi:MAG: tripartite tricarboxylate transporter TctB family protein [Spirochaetales bacterium]|nr:tripartite tricarboxylate transporter TctB family protein [Spirochaetales bacterium]
MKKLSTNKIIASAFLIFSIFYIIFGFSIEQRRMIGDQQGWDPGSRAIPIGTGFVMLIVSMYILLSGRKKKDADEKQSSDAASRRLVILSIVVPVLYIFLFRLLGFIVMTIFLLFTLIYFSYKKDIKREYIPQYLAGFAVSAVSMLIIYSIGRYITRMLIRAGKSKGVGFLSNNLFTSAVVIIAVALIFYIVILIKKTAGEKRKDLFVSVLTSVGVTEILYIIFKQIFWVSLAKGIVFW